MDSYKSKIMLYVGLAVVFIVTILRGLRLPNDWAEAHWLISYDFGIVKRGLMGTLINPLFKIESLISYQEIILQGISSIFLLIFLIMYLYMNFRLLKKTHYNPISIMVSLLFLSSPYLVMAGHLNGYYDNINIILTVVACFFVSRKQLWMASLCMVVAVFVHENIFILGLPSVIFWALIVHCKNSDSNNSTDFSSIKELAKYFPLIILPILAFSVIVINQTLFIEPELLKKEMTEHVRAFSFVQGRRHIFVPDAFTKSFFTYLQQQMPHFISRVTDLNYISRIIIPLLLVFIYLLRILKTVEFGLLIFISAIFIILLPLVLHMIAWDTSRLWTYPIIVALLAGWAIVENFGVSIKFHKNDIFFILIILMVLIYQILTSTPLMDNMSDRFSLHLRSFLYFIPLSLVFFTFAEKYKEH